MLISAKEMQSSNKNLQLTLTRELQLRRKKGER